MNISIILLYRSPCNMYSMNTLNDITENRFFFFFFLLTLRKSSAAFTFTFGFLGTFILLMISVVQEFQHPCKHPLCTTVSTAPVSMYRVHRLIEIGGFSARPYLYSINFNNYLSYLHKAHFGMPVLCNWIVPSKRPAGCWEFCLTLQAARTLSAVSWSPPSEILCIFMTFISVVPTSGISMIKSGFVGWDVLLEGTQNINHLVNFVLVLHYDSQRNLKFIT